MFEKLSFTKHSYVDNSEDNFFSLMSVNSMEIQQQSKKIMVKEHL